MPTRPRRVSRCVPPVRVAAVLSMLLAAGAVRSHAQKTDIVTMANGDAITGEVKGLERGKLDYDTDDVGRLSIKWTKVRRIVSSNYFEVESSSGTRYFGQLVDPEEDGIVSVRLDGQVRTVPVERVVRIVSLNAGFVSRLQVYLDVGVSIAKANRNLTANVNTETRYRGPRWGAAVSYTGYLQRQSEAEATTSNTLSLTGTRFLTHRWDVTLVTRYEQNDELNLVARFSGGGAGARRFVQTNNHELSGAAGAIVTSEQFASRDTTLVSPDTARANLEAMLGFEWAWFQFDSPKLDINVQATAYPSISQFGRVRGSGRTRVKYEVFKDFHLGLNFLLTFDSKPPDATAARTDYQTSVTVGWSFGR